MHEILHGMSFTRMKCVCKSTLRALYIKWQILRNDNKFVSGRKDDLESKNRQ